MQEVVETSDEGARPGYEPFPVARRRSWRHAIDGRLQAALPATAYERALAGFYGLRAFAGKNPGRGRMLPDFVILGAAKAGTTSLYAWLCQHPEVRRAGAKEIHYFSFYHYRGLDWYRQHFPPTRERDDFARTHGRAFITGEASPSYLMHEAAPQRMAARLPDIKLIVALRNPVDRAYSQFHMRRRDGQEPIDDFAAALRAEDARFAAAPLSGQANGARAPVARQEPFTRSYLLRGRYAEQLERWFAHFPRSQFHFVTTDEMAADPQRALDDVLRHVGLEPRADQTLKAFFDSAYEPMAPETRSALVEYFRPHNERLYRLLDREFGWDS